MPRSRVHITTSTHAGGLSLYGIQVALGVAYILDLAVAKSMRDLTNSTMADVWALALLTGGLSALMGALHTRQSPAKGMRTEIIACIVIALASLVYEVTLVVGNGWLGVVTTQIYAVGVATGCGFRAWQAHRERNRVIVALGEVS